MTSIQKGVACTFVLVGLQFAAGCWMQGQSSATAETQPNTVATTAQPSGSNLRDRLREKVSDRLDSTTASSAASPQVSLAPKLDSSLSPLNGSKLQIAQRPGGPNRSQFVTVIADQVVNRLNQTSCNDFRANINRMQSNQKDQMRERLLDAMKSNPELRRTFIDAIAAPLANKMFDCGLVPQ